MVYRKGMSAVKCVSRQPFAAMLAKSTIEQELTANRCCRQGYFNCHPCITKFLDPWRGCGMFGICMESLCCHGCAVSSTRMYVMDTYSLGVDPMDNQIIRFSNCMQCLSIICTMAAIIDETFADAAALVECIADLVYYATTGCMTAQVQ